jgi:hypothetical protein
MSRKTRMADLREAKDKRMKKIAVGGIVVLAVVLAFEVPKLLNRGGKSSSPPPAATTTPTTTPSGTAVAAVLPTGSSRLPDTDVAPKRSKSQLYSFNRFAGKDPFVQQIVDTTLGQPSSSGGSSTPALQSARIGKAGGSANRSGAASTHRSVSVRTLATSGSVRIVVNGKVETVRVGRSFPSSNPLFKLVSISHGSVRIGIASGSYASGANTVALTPGRTLTLVDTADGVRYQIRLLSAS